MWAWHCHHETLLERVYSKTKMEGRRHHIKHCKPLEEVDLRLKLFKRVKGKLPKRLLKAGSDLEKGRIYDYDYGEVFQKYFPEINKLHKKECLNCPWDGKTIFPQKKE